MASIQGTSWQRSTPYSILVVDDSKLNRAIIRKTVAEVYNVEVHEAEDGEAGWLLLNDRQFDLVLLDVVMPRLDGFGFLERWRNRNQHDFIPVILMTGLDDLNSKIRGLNVGADDFILKPINEKELVARVGSLLRLKQIHNELQQSLTDLERLKVQQDGDYFLTSLLVNPLGFNRVESGPVQVDFFVRQKKTFEFRKWQREIGGDICIADTVELRGMPHVVFINADAMGKSMQGAGGALVLGAAFGSILQNSANDRLYPEHWLVAALKTLQDIFEAFNGSMMVSMILGLIDERTGLMYYINAEHPYPVIFRQKKARFLDRSIQAKKIGWPGMNQVANLAMVELEPGDVIICGSDGRDDVLLGTDGSGSRIINEDENAFVSCVEDCKADLKDIFVSLSRRGDLTDDLSLLRLEWRGNAVKRDESALKTTMLSTGHVVSGDNNIVADARRAANELFRKEQWVQALNLAEVFLEIFPGDNTMLYLAARASWKSGKKEKAVALAERLLYRDRDFLPNVRFLIQCLRRRGQQARAEELYAEVREKLASDDMLHQVFST